jgi:hypothetical protein
VLADSPRGILLASEELAGWLHSFTRYRSGGGSDLPSWLGMHSAGNVVVSRKSSGTKCVESAFVSITGGIQPGIFAKLMKSDEFQSSGLLPRLLLAFPPERRKRWTDEVVRVHTKEAFEQLLTNLSQLIPNEGTAMPVVLDFTPEARMAFIEFYDRWNKETVATAVEEVERAALWKLEAYAARLALLIHVASHVQNGKDDTQALISRKSVRAGIGLVEWFANEVRRTYVLLGEEADEKRQRNLLDLIRRKGGSIYPRELCRANSRLYPTREGAEKALDNLVTQGLAEWREKPHEGSGRPGKKCFLRDGNCVGLCRAGARHNSGDVSAEDADTNDEEDELCRASGTSQKKKT